MKPHVQKLPLGDSNSFVAQTFRTPHFEVGWHQHREYELILFTEGSGLAFIGNHVGEFDTGDIYFLGANLPHTFRKRDADVVTSAIVVQFNENFWGEKILQLPESRVIRYLLHASAGGIHLSAALNKEMAPLIMQLENAKDFERVVLLAQCLQLMTDDQQYSVVSTYDIQLKRDERIDKVFQYTIDHFKEAIALSQVASIACMSIQHFCSFFKRATRKTYIDFLNEVRIGYACQLLVDTNKPVLDVCYESGYNTMANFHKQFLKIKKVTPLQYRKAVLRAPYELR